AGDAADFVLYPDWVTEVIAEQADATRSRSSRRSRQAARNPEPGRARCARNRDYRDESCDQAVRSDEKADDPRRLPQRRANARKVRENPERAEHLQDNEIPCK